MPANLMAMLIKNWLPMYDRHTPPPIPPKK